MRKLREAYSAGFTDGRQNQWKLEDKYPLPQVRVPRQVTLSDGSVITGSDLDGWKPKMGLAITVEDGTKLLDLWQFPMETKTVDDAV